MGNPPEAAQARFAKLADQLGRAEGTSGPRRQGFGSKSLFAGRKMFAILDGTGALVLKLPPARVAQLILDGTGGPWHPGKGAPLKEYLAVGLDHQAKWLALAKEARTYISSKA